MLRKCDMHIAYRMDHVGAEDDVERAEIERPARCRAFRDRRCVNSTSGIGRELLTRRREEGLRDIAERHTNARLAPCSGSTCDARPPVPAPISKIRRPRPSGRPRAASATALPMAASQGLVTQAIAVKLIEQIRAAAGEQDLHGLLLAAHDRVRVRAQVAPQSKAFRQMAWIRARGSALSNVRR